jgi:hypothetical protein
LAELQNDLEEKEQQVLITEKKSSNLVWTKDVLMFRISWQIKDLKRQLQSLQKKYDKAQEQLTSMESPSRQDSYSSRHSRWDQSGNLDDMLCYCTRDDSLSSVKGVLPLNDIKVSTILDG